MKTKNTKNKKTLLIFLSVLVVLSSSAAAFAFFSAQNNSKKAEISKEEESQKTANENNSKESGTTAKESSKSESYNEKNISTNSDSPNAPTLEKSSNKYRVNLTASADQSSSSEVLIRGLIELSFQNGSCQLTLTSPSGKTQTQNTEILMAPTTSSCKTIKLSTSSLEKGIWKYQLKYETDEIIGESSENTFEIK